MSIDALQCFIQPQQKVYLHDFAQMSVLVVDPIGTLVFTKSQRMCHRLIGYIGSGKGPRDLDPKQESF